MTDTGPDPDPGSGQNRRRSPLRILRALAIDITPLRRVRDFRLLWIGEVVTTTGAQVTLVAMFVQVYALTNSAAAVGLIGLVEFVPLMFATVIGGPFIDRHNRRNLLVATQLGLAATSAVLLYTAVVHDPPLWLIYTAAGCSAALSGIDVPTRESIAPALVDEPMLPAAMALEGAMYSTSVIIGPAIGGLVIAITGGVAWAYAIDILTYGITILLVLGMRPIPAAQGAGSAVWKAIKEGFAYLKGRRVLQSTFTIDLAAMVFGLPEALFPILAVEQFQRGAGVVGALFAAPAVGALIASLATGWVGRVRHQGMAVICAVVVWGAGITAFGLVGNHLVIALVLLAIAGGADVISAIFRSTILQASVPDELRGRLTSFHHLVVSGGPRLGNLESGLVAQAFGATFAVVSGGLLCIGGALLNAVLVPEFRKFHAGGKT